MPDALTPATIEPLSIDRDTRIDLTNEHGNAMADDEIRYHIMQLVEHQPSTQHIRSSFTFFEPLVFTCWNSIGRTIAERWCERNPQIASQGQQVVTAIALDNHWMPLWFVPTANTMQVHSFDEEGVDRSRVEHMLIALSGRMGFSNVTIHRIPKHVPDSTRCGAYAMAFPCTCHHAHASAGQ